MMKAILTGHTRGLGAAIAEELLERKIPVLGLARARNDELAQRYPSLLTQVELDLSDQTAVLHWLANGTLQRFVHDADSALLINNAGVAQPVGSLETQDVLAIANAVTVNVAAPLMLAGAFGKASTHVQDRRVLHISSGAGSQAYPSWSIYCATKAALDHHARSVALDRTPGLRICSLAPGVIDTDMQAEIRATSLDQFPLRERFDNLKRDGGLADAADCAERVVKYLLAEQFGKLPVTDLRDSQ